MHEYVSGFSVREVPWHGLGHVPQEYLSREDAMALAGHDFRVIERPILVMGRAVEPETVVDPLGYVYDSELMPHSYKAAHDFKALIHSKTGAILNIVKDSYGVVQNDVLWDIVDALVDQPNVKYETAGVLRGGSVLWVLAKLDEPDFIAGDVDENGKPNLILPFITASTTHDGSGAAQARATSVRIVCMNTYGAAEAESGRTGREFTFKHTKNVMAKIEDAKMALKGVRLQHEAFMALARELAEVKVSREQRDLFISQFIPMPPEALISKRVEKNVEDARQSVRVLFNDGSKTIPEAHRLTGYGLFQAGTEYMDHLRKFKTQESYFGRTMMKQEPAKAKLAKLIRECAIA